MIVRQHHYYMVFDYVVASALRGSSQGRLEARWSIVTKITPFIEVCSPSLATHRSRRRRHMTSRPPESSISGFQICTTRWRTCQHSVALYFTATELLDAKVLLALRLTYGASGSCYMCWEGAV
jgi:hypothetical protein